MAVPVLLLTGALLQTHTPFEALSRDLIVYAGEADECCKVYYGALSNLGIMIWTFAAGAGVLTGVVFFLLHMQQRNTPHKYKPHAVYFLAAGFMSLVLAIDDMFLVHEVVAPHFGIPEEVVLATYALLALLFAIVFFKRIISFSPFFFVMAVGFLMASMMTDVANDLFDFDLSYEVEDSAKFLGIAAWSAYFFRSSYSALVSAFIRAEP